MVEAIIIHDLRSIHNVGSILRSCDGFGVKSIYIGGTSPYPRVVNDKRLPHIIEKQSLHISKTALGAEKSLNIYNYGDVYELIGRLKKTTTLVGLEQTADSINIKDFEPTGPVTLIIGREVEGLDSGILKLCDQIIEIEMKGGKESFNVSVATGIALYQLCN